MLPTSHQTDRIKRICWRGITALKQVGEADGIQRQSGLVCQFSRCSACFAGAAHRDHGVSSAFLRTAGQGSNFVGDHGKSTTRIAGLCCFKGGVQSLLSDSGVSAATGTGVGHLPLQHCPEWLEPFGLAERFAQVSPRCQRRGTVGGEQKIVPGQ